MGQQLRDDLQQAYDQAVQERAEHIPQPWKVMEREAFLALLRQEGKESLLEIGAGTGHDALFFQEAGLAVQCIDLSPQMVRHCQAQGLQAQVMDMKYLNFPDASFDAVHALNSLLHIPKEELPAVLQEVDRVLKPDGLFYLGVYGGYDHEGVWEDDHYRPQRFFSFFSDEHLQEAVRPFFDIYSFQTVATDTAGDPDRPYFQALTLRKRP